MIKAVNFIKNPIKSWKAYLKGAQIGTLISIRQEKKTLLYSVETSFQRTNFYQLSV